MTGIQFVLHPLPGTDEQFVERLRESSDKISKLGYTNPEVFDSLKTQVKELVIGPSHIGILLEDGRAYRVAFSINSDQLDLSNIDPTKSAGSNLNSCSTGNTKSAVNVSTRQLARSRAKLLRSGSRSALNGHGSRSSGVIIGGNSSRPLVSVPAPFVPEELISQAEVVLQGKSRNLIIRELQRTNLDVNLAVNNLLSRDDEEAEDAEQAGDNYAPDDLISLLDNGFHSDNSNVVVDPADGLFSEEIFSNYSSIRNLLFNRIRSERNQVSPGNSDSSSNAVRSGSSTSTSVNPVPCGSNSSGQLPTVNADSFSRWRDRQCYGPRRWFGRDDAIWEKDSDGKRKETCNNSPLWISEELQAWPEKDGPVRFQKIASLYSEFIGLSETGELHQWRWAEVDAFKSDMQTVYHPKTLTLNINERIVFLSSNSIRCTVATETNRVATWMDEHLGIYGLKLEHSLHSFLELSSEGIHSLYTSALFTVVRTMNQNLYWWGVLPFEQRRHLWDKFRSKTKKPTKLANEDITVGTQVVMKKCPIYQTGSIGFTYINGIPKVGQLLNSVWDFTDVCRFKVFTTSSPSSTCPEKINSSQNEKETPKTSQASCSKIATSSNKETTDRLDMPPPPSPASSTCSDNGTATSHKRPKRVSTKDDGETKKDEEFWLLKDVVFVEDRSGPIGKILKVDGDYVAVRFALPAPTTESKEDDWQHCRLLKKEDVQIVKSIINPRGPDCFQKAPKRLNISTSTDSNNFQLLTLAVDTKGVHTISKVSSKLYYNIFNLHNSKQELSCVFPTDCNAFLGNAQSNIAMYLSDDSNENCTVILRDGNRTIYPFVKDCIGSIKDPQWLNFPPVKTVAMSTVSLPIIGINLKSKVCITVMIVETQHLMPSILRCDLKGVIMILSQLEGEQQNAITSVLKEKCDGGRNILHTCAVMCSPTSNKQIDDSNNFTSKSSTSCRSPILESSTSSTREGCTISLREMMNRLVNTDSESRNTNVSTATDESYFPLSYWQSEYETNSTEEEFTNSNPKGNANKLHLPIYITDPNQRREQSVLILQQMCVNSTLRPHLHYLLSSKDAEGQTPFMLSVASRAYDASLILFNTILSLSDDNPSIKESMIFPVGSSVDQSPLHIICYNDTCSFTWTGADHINQNIFECKTCGLTGSLCCCTECARVCHKGHDCKLKRTSPTAYCDCWEKCKCKALLAGNQSKRFSLLCKLVSNTDLVTKFNSRGESILLFLIQTVGRQSIEQKQYRISNRTRNTTSSGSRKTQSSEIDSEMPEHDLEPPKFAKKALERLLVDWLAVKSMIMTGADDFSQNGKPKSNENVDDCSISYLKSQSGSTLLDKFTHNLFVKCSPEHLDILISTLLREMQDSNSPGKSTEAKTVARRFVRSVARVFVIFNLEKSPTPDRRKNNVSQSKHIQNCIKVFQALHIIAIEELCEVADALIAPVRLGVVRPTAPFAMSSSNLDNSEDLFSVEPLAPSTTGTVFRRNLSMDVEREPNTNINIGLNYGVLQVEDNNDVEVVADNTSHVDSPTIRVSTDNPAQDSSEGVRQEEVIPDDESDNEFNFNDADTESDSDDNQSSQDAQRSVQTGATVGSETDDESGDSSPADEEGSDDGETDENSEEGYTFVDSQLERRTAGNHVRTVTAPPSMHWAIRNREQGGRSSVRLPTGSGLVFIDPLALRRTTIQNSSLPTHSQEPHSMATTASSLARAFGIIIRQISDLFNSITYILNHDIESHLKVTYTESVELQSLLETRLKQTWNWVFSVMDGTEAQLKFGAYLTNSTDPAHPLHPLNLSSQSVNQANIGINILGSTSSRREFFTYCLSLMRAHTSEHRDSLPVLDITALRHIAYVLDGIIFYMRNENGDKFDMKQENLTGESNANEDSDEDFGVIIPENNTIDEDVSADSFFGRKHCFFKRSDSTLSLGCCAPDPFALPLEMALPLADRPHLLQPNAKREDLFSNLPLPITTNNRNSATKGASILETPPMRLGLSSYSKQSTPTTEDCSKSKKRPSSPNPNQDKIEASSINMESCGNLYVQLKKKSYLDQHESDIGKKTDKKILAGSSKTTTSNETEAGINKRAEFTKMPEEPTSKLPTDMSIRPEVIIATKTAFPGNQNANVLLKSTSRTVIVRAGQSSNTNPENRTGTQNVVSFETKSRQNLPQRGQSFRQSTMTKPPTWNLLLGRWKLSLDLFGRVFMDDVGLEHGSILSELRGFPVKETRFRRQMEKIRNGQQRDLVLSKLERNRESLITQTFKELNTQFGTQNRRVHPPLTFNRVKVTFKEEPGEGSGVARSFYTSMAEALLVNEKLPNLEVAQIGSSNKYGLPFSSILRNRNVLGRDTPLQRKGNGNKILWRSNKEKKSLNLNAKPFMPSSIQDSNNPSANVNEHLSVHLQQLGERLYPKISAITNTHAAKVTGMLLETPPAQLLIVLSSEDTLRQKVNEALDVILHKQKSESVESKKIMPVVLLEQIEDNDPLFYSPGKRGFYSPRQGYASFERINAFRNVGRLIGLCLLQNELFPLFLQRHVLKYILGKQIRFHDLAFFDPTVYESFRQLIQSSHTCDGADVLNKLELYFVIDLIKEEGGGNVELSPGGKSVQVCANNIYDYVRRYGEYRMVKSQEKALEAIKSGVFDVLPECALDSLTSEDLRLLLNGVGDINVNTLISYTTFNDESSENSEKLLKFKKWFWCIVEKMNITERQDLLYFWTGSPALPASEEGFQPLPSITIRPIDDYHLPTANTCISRLYIPLYSNKAILRTKLLLAIKSKNFGFV